MAPNFTVALMTLPDDEYYKLCPLNSYGCFGAIVRQSGPDHQYTAEHELEHSVYGPEHH